MYKYSRDLRIYAIKELAAIVRAFYGSRNKVRYSGDSFYIGWVGIHACTRV